MPGFRSTATVTINASPASVWHPLTTLVESWGRLVGVAS